MWSLAAAPATMRRCTLPSRCRTCWTRTCGRRLAAPPCSPSSAAASRSRHAFFRPRSAGVAESDDLHQPAAPVERHPDVPAFWEARLTPGVCNAHNLHDRLLQIICKSVPHRSEKEEEFYQVTFSFLFLCSAMFGQLVQLQTTDALI